MRSTTKLSDEKTRYSHWRNYGIEFNSWQRTIDCHSFHLTSGFSAVYRYKNWSSGRNGGDDLETETTFVREEKQMNCRFVEKNSRFDFRHDFLINVQRNISISVLKSKFIIDVVWDRIDRVEFRKNSTNSISLILPDRPEKRKTH